MSSGMVVKHNNMVFVVYNSLSKRKEPFESLEPGLVRMYNCGPTVYNRQHIGNFRSFLFADLLRRWLEYLGYEVRQVMNITDVGHLQNEEAETGEDKIELQARREGRDPWKISEAYAEQFLDDLRALDVREAGIYPRATQHIPEMLEMIQGLIDSGHAYQVGGNVYFDVTRFERYGRLSGNRVEDLEAGSRIEINTEKRQPEDFALWKSDPKHLMKWDCDYGPDGFPGWHIECSAMARKHLGDQIDIHTGGEDNIFPHHECEIAQSEAFTGKSFARYWMHAKFLLVDGGKMAKSLGNVYSLDDIQERGFSLRALRYALLRGHYRQPLNFTWEILAESAAAMAKLDDLVARVTRAVGEEALEPDHGKAALEVAREKFEASMNDDLGTPGALSALFEFRSAVERDGLGAEAAKLAMGFLEGVHNALGVLDLKVASDLDSEVEALIGARKEAREAGDWGAADKIRDQLTALGIVLEDTPEGVLWRRG